MWWLQRVIAGIAFGQLAIVVILLDMHVVFAKFVIATIAIADCRWERSWSRWGKGESQYD